MATAATPVAGKNNKTKAFSVIFFLEFWERFGYYGLMAILTLFFVQSLHMTDAESFATYGAFSALCYGLIAVGGFIGDKYLGTKRTIVLGAVTLAIGYFLMSFAGESRLMVFTGLATIAVGNGFFKANPSSMVSKIYAGDPAKVESAFTLYYMAINVGSFISMLITPWTSAAYSHGVSYMICALGMVGALLIFVGGYGLLKSYDSPIGFQPFNMSRLLMAIVGGVVAVAICTFLLSNRSYCNWLVALVGIVAVLYFLKEIIGSRGVEQRKMIVALVLIVEAVIFFTLYNQMPTSINFFSIRNTNHSILGGLITMDPLQFQSFNPFWVVALSPLLAWVYTHAGKTGSNISMPWKFTWGMLLCSAAFLILSVSSWFAKDGIVSGDWVFGSYFFQSFGELLISGLGLAMVAQLVPERMQGFIMGVWFLSNTAASILGGLVAGLTNVPEGITDPVQILGIYVGVFNNIGFVTLAITIVMALFAGKLTKLIQARATDAKESVLLSTIDHDSVG